MYGGESLRTRGALSVPSQWSKISPGLFFGIGKKIVGTVWGIFFGGTVFDGWDTFWDTFEGK